VDPKTGQGRDRKEKKNYVSQHKVEALHIGSLGADSPDCS
jgi:hypothetical protein